MIINSKIYNIPSTKSKLALTENTRLVIISANLTGNESELLQKMLSATGLNVDEFMHIIADNADKYVNFFDKKANNLKIISFDVPIAKLGLQVLEKKYRMFNIQQTEIVFVDDLASIGEELNLKKYIWKVLKTWFVNEK